MIVELNINKTECRTTHKHSSAMFLLQRERERKKQLEQEQEQERQFGIHRDKELKPTVKLKCSEINRKYDKKNEMEQQ